ncbi:MAG: hypothetical protein M0R06_00100 [Sphaerochaeta sp.]|jgi:hypothetical protein|nr:hypothetical protein [Sphaerochaeta sp.]
MGTILCQDIVDAAEVLLYDTGNAKWTEAGHFTWLKDGQRFCALIKPDISIQTSAIIQVAGVKQSISGSHLIAVTRNMGTDGTTPGKGVNLVSMADMNRLNPDWTTDTASAIVDFYMYDPKNPNVYYVSPPQPATGFGYLEIIQAISPTDPAAIGNAITIDDIYAPVLINYICHRAYLMDAPFSPYSQVMADKYLQYVITALGGKDVKEQSDAPTEEKRSE